MKISDFYLFLLFLLLRFGPVAGDGFIAIGDWGADSEEQYATARAMSAWCQRESCRFVVSTGDNFYPSGVTSSKDPRFNSTWRNVYDLKGIRDKTWIVALGNHDYDEDKREFKQVEFGKTEPKWDQPHLWFEEPLKMGNSTLHLLILDTMALIRKTNNYKKQLQWLDTTLKGSKSRWKIVVAHHPAYTVGKHSPGDADVRKSIVPILEKYGVDVLLLGHDHNLQHINRTLAPPPSSPFSKKGRNFDHVISGAGGKGLYDRSDSGEEQINKLGQSLRFFSKSHGFVAFDFEGDELQVRYVATEPSGKVVYRFSRRK